MMLELLILAVLCSSTQGRLVQVGNEETCSNDIVIFWCTSETQVLKWMITRSTGADISFSLSSIALKTNLTQDFSLVAQVSFINGSFINATATFMRPNNLNGTTITCNGDMLTLTANTGPLPTSLNISQNEPGNMLDIHWSSEQNDYCNQSSHMKVNGSWNYAATAFYTLPLENKTYELTIPLHPVMNMASNFTIGPCLFYDQLIMERNYTLELNGTWTIFQECTNSRVQFDTTCGSSGNWATDMRCPAINDTTSTQGEPETTTTQGESTNMSESTKSSPANVGQSQILISSLITIGVLIILAVIVAIICFKLIGKRKKKKSREYPAQAEFSVSHTYENVVISMKGLVYEEVELEDKTTNIDLSQNIAYEQVKKTAF